MSQGFVRPPNLNPNNTSVSSRPPMHKLNTKLNETEQKLKEKIKEMQPVLSSIQLKNLDEHKYSTTGSTFLDFIFQPYWRWLVEQLPYWVAPNLITIVGLFLNVITSTILMIYSPNSDNDNIPSWVFHLCAIGLFVYQSLDAIDGKQARRTGSSSPLGELFDHGCDAISTVFVIIAFCTTLKLGQQPWLLFFLVTAAMVTFYVAHWQTYVTGNLKFGKLDVTEAQCAVYLVYILTGFFGDSLWEISIPVLNISLRYVPIVSAVIGSIISISSNLNIISQGGKGKNGSSVANTSIVFPVFPILLYVFLSFSIASKSVTDLYVSNICLYCITFGLVWSKITIKLIIAHMTKGEIFLLDSCLIGPTILFLNQYFNHFLPEIYLLYFCLAIASYDLIKYCTKVCYQICTHMNIYLFKIIPVISQTASSTTKQH